jgi:hypothetical protein
VYSVQYNAVVDRVPRSVQHLAFINSMEESITNAHRSLTGQEIRLIEIFPSKFASDALRCRRFKINLDAIQMYPYEALSYVWGDESNTTEVFCDGSSVSVTSSLASALKRLRLRHRSRLIWADAICIDQENSSEKNHQIPIMGKIYSMADRVVVWLGEVDSAQTEGVEEIVQHIANHIRNFIHEGGFDESGLHGHEALQIPDDYINTTAREVLRLLYDNPWFYRIWCVQEIVLAKDATMLWGEHELSWADVGMIAAWLNAVVPVRALEYDMHAFYAGIEASHAYEMYRFQRKPHDLLELLDACWGFNASNARDRVYGLLALVEPKEEARALCVDYDKSVGEVYADTVVAWIQLYADLAPLSYVDHGSAYPRSRESLTSWTPQWHLSRDLRRILYDDSPLSACKNIPVKSIDASKINMRHLRLEGIYYSEITSVYATMDLDSLKDHKKHPFLDTYHEIVGQPNPGMCQLHPDMAEIPPKSCVLARTLTAGCNSARKDIIDASHEDQIQFFTDFLLLICCLEAGLDHMALRNELPHQESFYDQAEIVCMNRRLFRTRTGNFGLGPGSMRTGDIIAVLFGGDSPYVLRPYGEFHLFIGQVYVDNLMQGELVDAMEAGTVHEQEFCLV